ncbi:potassium channel family protein [Rufibacter roseus]|uniref:Potassium channel family protein n=1 Tax=Rufibacter roseus TaxID=1567108 RepID=A0ABW2DII1_9BACT|nr:potassium channel family protein [Rufibacter roseus]
MNTVLLITGILLLIIALVEGLWTTIWVDGNSAPITGRLTSGVWKGMRAVISSKSHKALSLAGPFILFLTVIFWIVLLWLGWSLVFYADQSSIDAKDGSPPDLSDAMWYVAYCMFTIGNGDFMPKEDGWQLLSSLVGLTGMALVTLSITYVLQVVSAVVNKRAFASQVTSIGQSAEEFVLKQWNGKDFGAIELQLNSLSGQLAVLDEQHMAFPILHYYHAADYQKSQDVAITILDDALTLIEFGIKEEHQPAQTILASTRNSISTFLQTVQSAFITAAKETPEAPKLVKLTNKGLPTVPEQEFHHKLEEKLKDRRKLLLGLTQNGAWEWPA